MKKLWIASIDEGGKVQGMNHIFNMIREETNSKLRIDTFTETQETHKRDKIYTSNFPKDQYIKNSKNNIRIINQKKKQNEHTYKINEQTYKREWAYTQNRTGIISKIENQNWLWNI